jgi:glutaredoxin
MTHRRSPSTTNALLGCASLLGAVLCVTPALAQYKVVGPDGKTTYTDRAPAPADGRVTSLGARGTPVSSEVALPQELRQATSRYPATLYVTNGACEPCDGARQLLRQRGVPFTEKQIVSAEDAEALERLTGARDSPTLTLGSQTMKGLSPELWNSRRGGLPARVAPSGQLPVPRRDAVDRAARSPARRGSCAACATRDGACRAGPAAGRPATARRHQVLTSPYATRRRPMRRA